MAKTLTAIHIGTRVVNALAIQPVKRGGKDEYALVAGGTLPLPEGEDPDLAPVLRQLVRSMKVSAHQPATLVLAKQQAIIRSVLLPSVDPAELAQMARFEAERHIPFNAERHSVGYHVMRSRGVEGSEVLLAAVDGPVVDRGLGALAGTGLMPDGITISSTCLVNSLFYGKEKPETRTLAILSIGLDSLGIVFLSQGRILYAREIAMDLRTVLEAWIGHRADSGGPAPDLAKLAVAAHMIDCDRLDVEPSTMSGGEDSTADGVPVVRRWLARVGQEIQRTYDFARREMKCPPLEGLALTGEGGALRHLDEYLARETGIVVEVLNPVGTLVGSEKLKFAFNGLEYVIAFGALVGRHRAGAYNIDLTPMNHYKALARKSLMRQLIVTGGLAVATLGLCGFTFKEYKDLRAQTIQDYVAINEKLKPKFAQLDQMITKTKIIEKFVRDPNAALSVFNSVVNAPMVPGSVFFQRVDFSKGETFTVEGTAKTIEDISAFKAYLNGTKHFIDVTSSGSNPTDMWGNSVYPFKIDCQIKSTGGAEE